MPVYEPNPKHKWGFTVAGPPVHVPSGSKCPRELPETAAADMLNEGIDEGYVEGTTSQDTPKRVYNYRDGIFYRAEITRPEADMYHGMPVEPIEVPTRVKRLMRDRGKLSQREYKRFRASRH